MPYEVKTLSLSTTAVILENQVNAYLLTAGENALLIDAGYAESAIEINRQLTHNHLKLQAIYLTHFHPDHSLGALEIANEFRVPIHCHPLEYKPLLHVYDKYLPGIATDAVIPDLTDGCEVPFAGERLQVLHIPGHSHGHIAIFDNSGGHLFIGDHVIPEGTVWIGPPDGHLIDYLESMDRLLSLPVNTLYPGHGHPLPSPQNLMRQMKRRRLDRENEILSYLQTGELTIAGLVERMYKGKIPEAVIWAAAKTVTAHLQKLLWEKRIQMRYRNPERLFYYTAIQPNSRSTDSKTD